jgi:hypothetical protein
MFSTQHFPAGTPQVGQGTENNSWGVSSFFFIRAECDDSRETSPFGNLPVLAGRPGIVTLIASLGRYSSVHTPFYRSLPPAEQFRRLRQVRKEKPVRRFVTTCVRGLAVSLKNTWID